MQKKAKAILPVSLALVLIAFFMVTPVFAAFSLSVTPFEGGFDLQFKNPEPGLDRINKEVTVRISSNIAKQYRVTQTLLGPLTTSDGKTIPQNNFVVYSLVGTNSSGTFNIGQEIPVTISRQMIYTSNQTGAPDSFNLGYGLILRDNVSPGSYRGRIAFTLEPVNSAQPPSTVVLNMYAEVVNKSSIEIKTLNGSRDVILKQGNENSDFGAVAVAIKGNFGTPFKIIQQAEQELVSTEGEILNFDAVNFIGKEAHKGSAIAQLTPLSSRQQVVYASSQRGEEDNFIIQYGLGDLSSQKAGAYRGRIRYILEAAASSQTKLIETLGFEVDIPKIFDLVITPELGGSIRFNDLRASQPPRIQEVIFEIKTNTGRPYQVMQSLNAPLATKEGKVISSEYFNMQEESIDTKGSIKYAGKTAVKEGQAILLVSDRKGSPTKFKVIYELAPPKDLQSGDYSAVFTYSIVEI